MPTADALDSIEVEFSGGYFPSAPALAPEGLQGTIRRGNNAWLRPGGKIEVANGPLQVSSTSVGARIFDADIQRATIAGGLIGSRLPYGGLLRHQNAVLLYVSENTSAQVYLNETAVAGLTTSATAGRLRVALPAGGGAYNVFDAGFGKPVFSSSNVTTVASIGVKNMRGFIGVAIAPWRSLTGAWGPPSEVVYNDIQAGTNTVLNIVFPTAVSGQDGWLILGTRWNDPSGQVEIIRYLYLFPRGTLTANNGVATITGLNTFWTQDLALGDELGIDAATYTITAIISDTEVTINPVFGGVSGSGKTISMGNTRTEWYDSELRGVIDRNIQRPLPAAGVAKFAERIFLWGIPDTTTATSSQPTGNGFAVMLDNNPEHIGILANVTASGGDFVNALAGDGAFYFMTTLSLEVIDRKGTEDQPFIPRVVARPGFKAATNGCLDGDWFYGFTNRPLRTRARENIDFLFAAPVWDDMDGWDGARVIVQTDPDNQAVLYFYDNGSTTTVRPWMTQQNVWNPPITLSARVLDARVVNGKLYITYYDGANIRVNQWEGGTGLTGAYVSSQYYDPKNLARNRIKRLTVAGKVGTLGVFAAKFGATIPDVSVLGQAEVVFTESDLAEMLEGESGTNIEGGAFAFRVDLPSNDGTVQKIVARGIPRGE
jgi:hypothetical protein